MTTLYGEKMVSFRLLPFYPQEKCPRYPSERKLGGVREGGGTELV